jgi:hypothetical protein
MTAAHPFSAIPITGEERLGALAMQFRGTRRDSERQDIARESSLLTGSETSTVAPAGWRLPPRSAGKTSVIH